ncbi:MAG: hypothetical protein ISR48_08605 [Alphaproteobacteria bacterium]|nr:hypothetical protein [Alphaproteobacteria bacterium]
MTAYFFPTIIPDASRRSFLLRGAAVMAAALSSGLVPFPARAAAFPALFNSRQHQVMPNSAVAANMAALEVPRDGLRNPGASEVARFLPILQERVNARRYRPGTRSEDFTVSFHRGDGDCRDFAVAKYRLLRRFGLAHHDLRLVLLHLPPTRRPRPERRAQTVLAVNLGGKIGVLDNFHNHVLAHEGMLGCRPLWSLNRHGLWYHRGRDLTATEARHN